MNKRERKERFYTGIKWVDAPEAPKLAAERAFLEEDIARHRCSRFPIGFEGGLLYATLPNDILDP